VLNNPPPVFVGPDRDPFMHGPQGRLLRLVADDESIEDSPAERLLEQLGHRPSARVHWTRRPASTRATLKPLVRERDYVPALIEDGEDAIETAIPAASHISERSATFAREHGVARDDVERLLQLATLGRTWNRIDAIVVGSTLLSGPPLDRLLLPQCQTPAEALALLGLNLRAHGDFAVSREGSMTRAMDGAQFYRAVAFEHVEGLDSWMGGATSHWLHSGARPWTLLDGIATRLGRAFRARDYLQVRLRALDFEAVWDEVLFFFDVVLIHAMGALDLLARLLHDLYALPGFSRHASWRSRRLSGGWVTALVQAAPRLGDVAAAGQPVGDVVDLVAELRNFIHEVPPSSEIRDADDFPGIHMWGAGLIALVRSGAADTMLAAGERRGGLVVWGLSDRRAGSAVVLDPGRFAEQALRSCTAAVSSVLALVDRERLATGPPVDVARGVPNRQDRENAAALFGLSAGGLRQERVTSA